MSYTFDEIMAFHPDNEAVYKEIKELLVRKRLVPFVGAGLTQFAYYSWSKLIRELSKKLINEENIAKVEALIKAGKYLEAADKLADLRGESNLAHDLAGLLSADKHKQNQERLRKEAISLLPLLFKELVITTNFDETLETVYRDARTVTGTETNFDAVLLPGRRGFFNQLLREGGARVLYKLHGTVIGSRVDSESFVFTKKQYDERYGEDSALTMELKDCFNKNVMLFLGCSLNNDRTMELLQEVIKPGDDHYTIINCKRSERDEKIRQLADKHIRAIVYEGNRHEAVRVILEHLLEETDSTAYKDLRNHVGALEQTDSLDRFSYKSDFIPFAGRKEELKQLNDFLGDPMVPFRWWAVTGPGGSGKSRLVYEFQKKLPQGWTARYLTRADYENLPSLTKEITKKELIIADYVQQHAKELGAWMEDLNETHRSLPIRVLLVEREADDNQDRTLLSKGKCDNVQNQAMSISAWTKQIYEATFHEEELKNACYKEDFLKLRPLGDDDLLKIIEDYAENLNKNALIDTDKHMLLDKLKSVDRGLCRPLYAMFLTDAYAEGDDPEKWSQKEILEYVTKREQKRLQFNIEQAVGTQDITLYNACLHLLSMATVLQDASLSELQKFCPDPWKIIEQKADRFVSPTDMLERVGLAVNGQIPALRPDLIGEYYVYTWLLELRKKASKKTKEFLFAAWRKPYPTAVFFDRLLKDYYYLLNESAENWKLILPGAIPLSEGIAMLYAGALVNATHYCKIVNECKRQVKMQEAIVQKYPNNLFIAMALARSFSNLSAKQDVQGAQNSIDHLEHIAKEHKDSQDIAISLALGLVHLSFKQDEQGRKDTVDRLESLAKEHEGMPKIAIAFAMSLFALIFVQDEQGAKQTVDRLGSLSNEHKDVKEIAICFAMGLVNFAHKQDEQNAKKTVDRLESLVNEHKDVPEIAIWFAVELAHLSYGQDGHEAQNTITRLERFTNENQSVLDFTFWIDEGLIKLSNNQEEPKEEMIKRLDQFLVVHLLMYNH